MNYETVVNLIGDTTTKSSLKVQKALDTNEYETGVKATNDQMEGSASTAISASKVQPHDLTARLANRSYDMAANCPS